MPEIDEVVLQQARGRQQTETDHVGSRTMARLALALNRTNAPSDGECLPLPWHWLLFAPIVRGDTTGLDGHPERGRFLPDVPLPRRMWAAGSVRKVGALRVGDEVLRKTSIADTRLKQGRSGTLLFVDLRHEIFSGNEQLIEETQQLVYREAPSGPYVRPDPGPGTETPQAHWRHHITPDPVLLFRYSALTYNGHRIHYDQSYATSQEGYPGLVVQGPLVATLLLESLYQEHPGMNIVEFDFRARSPLFEGEPMTLCGRIQGRDIELWAQGPGGQVAFEIKALGVTAEDAR